MRRLGQAQKHWCKCCWICTLSVWNGSWTSSRKTAILVSSLLVLYGLHPLDLESRVARAVERVRLQVRKGGGELELLSIERGVVRLQLRVTGHGCGSTARTLKTMVEDALYEAAPDMNRLLIEGLEEQVGSSGFVPLGKLGGLIAAGSVTNGGS
jgi:Fe-S cluster biogenesis protein NfuA